MQAATRTSDPWSEPSSTHTKRAIEVQLRAVSGFGHACARCSAVAGFGSEPGAARLQEFLCMAGPTCFDVRSGGARIRSLDVFLEGGALGVGAVGAGFCGHRLVDGENMFWGGGAPRGGFGMGCPGQSGGDLGDMWCYHKMGASGLRCRFAHVRDSRAAVFANNERKPRRQVQKSQKKTRIIFYETAHM